MKKMTLMIMTILAISLFGITASASAGNYYFPADSGILQWEDQKCGTPFAYNESYMTEEFGCPPLLYFIVIKKATEFKAKPLAAVDLYGDGNPWAVHLFGCARDYSISGSIQKLKDEGYIILRYHLVPNDGNDGDTVAMGRIIGLPPVVPIDPPPNPTKTVCPAINMLLLDE